MRRIVKKCLYFCQQLQTPPVQRAVMLSGPRQVGKTTPLLQAIQQLLSSGVPLANILCVQKPSIARGYVITKDPHDIGLLQEKYMRIPASLFCYWLGASEFSPQNIWL